MSDKHTLARPYAKAAFAYAQAGKRLDDWAQALARAAAVVTDKQVAPLLNNPNIPRAELGRLVADIAAGSLGSPLQNFIAEIAENRRLNVLPQIAERFAAMKEEAERVIGVEVTSAAPLSEAQRAHFTAALEKRIQRSEHLSCSVDPQLIGGAVLRAGDLVIDGSLRSQLARIGAELAT